MLCRLCFRRRYLFVRLRRVEGAALTEPVNQSQIKIDPTVVWWLPRSGLHASDLREMISDRFTALKSASSKRHEINTRVFPITGSIKLCGLYRTFEDCHCTASFLCFCLSCTQKKSRFITKENAVQIHSLSLNLHKALWDMTSIFSVILLIKVNPHYLWLFVFFFNYVIHGNDCTAAQDKIAFQQNTKKYYFLK